MHDGRGYTLKTDFYTVSRAEFMHPTPDFSQINPFFCDILLPFMQNIL
jgi:hypothetical protein